MSAPQGTTAVPDDRVDPAVWRLAFTVIVGALAVVFDTTIVSVAINDLGRDLGASLGTIQWISTGYLLAMFVTIPIAGWAQSVLGGKRLWTAALGIFLLGSVLCALAWDAPSLIAFRVVQGVGGGVMMPLMITLIMQAAGGRNIGKVMATVTLPAALGPILGPVLGGIILNLGDWRWLFLVNIPFCAVGAWLALRNLPDDRPAPAGSRVRLDAVGLLLLSPGVAAVIYGLSQVEGGDGVASLRVVLPVLAGLALIGGFVAWAVPRSSRALVDVRLFRHRPLASSSALSFLAGATLYGAMLLLPLYLQQVRGEDALGAGLLLIPQGVGTLMSRTLVGRFTDRYGPRWIAFTGFAVVAAATVPFAFVTAGTSIVPLMAALLVRGFGMGAVNIPLASAGYTGLDRADVPHASIISRVAMQIGGSVGTAVLAVILQHTASGARTPDALADAFAAAFWWSVGFTAVAVPLTLLLPGRARPAPAEPAGRETGDTVRADTTPAA
ncbi:DHA2 family efflux MFS transporter permease subunit [Actinomadura sp. LD22]|uniref:DHA2 family efflux MFS transporter permease subunit n=1 Tax=Actinomadura physcomitrii TaxID=2650748 RepID=A0A6I4MG05_9ACTN|nr:MDR family MFS transporter [Actinomadura physcomitrii]MWA02927.1 DHA2 family efflux MFS transporter permease subunit [Actinomadura physcomitrii]